jgi:NTE family protein
MTAERAKFGLALAGGFMYGFAHLGVLEVLEERGLRPGWLAGTSAGALAAAFTAFGIPASETAAALEELGWGSITRAHPFTHLGFATNEGLEDILLGALGEVRIEDADIPLGVVTTDINTGERVLLDHGPLATAVRASCCIPGLFAPVEVDGRLLVDGALVENVPVHVVREMGAPVVVAVSFGLALRFRPVESWRQVMSNAFDIAVNSQRRFDVLTEADILIDPPVDGMSWARVRDREAILEAGRQRTREAIPALEEILADGSGDVVSAWRHGVRQRLVGGSAAKRPE